MLEILSVGKKADGFHGPWNGVIPPQDLNTLFRMHTFTAVADVKDKGPSAVPVTNTGVTVGSDSLNSYMKFNGSNAFLAFSNALLSTNSMDITVIVGDIVYPTTAPYYFPIIDGRPNNTNGKYAAFATVQTPPFKPVTVFQSVEYYSKNTVPETQFPAVIRYEIRPGSITTFVNDFAVQKVEVQDISLISPQSWRVGRGAFASVAGVPWLNAKIYYLDFKKV